MRHLILIFSIVLFATCKKAEIDGDTQSVSDHTLCEAEFTKIPPMINEFGLEEEGVKTLDSNCTSITMTSPGKFPVTATIEFNADGCEGEDGKVRRGKIVAIFSAPWDSASTSVTVSLEDYWVDNVQFEGNILIDKTLTSFTTTVSNGKASWTGGDMEWSGTRTLTWTAGMGTPSDGSDDIFSITGQSEGKNRRGQEYSTKITRALVKRTDCAWVSEGTLELTPSGKAARTIEYGEGTCDNQATMIVNGNTFDFELK